MNNFARIGCAFVIGALGLSLSGCIGSQIRGQMAAEKADADCQAWGAKPGTPTYVQCRAQLAQVHQMDEANRTARIGLIQKALQPPPSPSLARTSFSCTTQPWALGTRTTCN